MQDLLHYASICPYYVKEHMKDVAFRCVVLSLKFELSESTNWLSINHTLVIFRFKSCPISSEITKLYFILNIIQLPKGIIQNSVPLRLPL